VVDSRVKIPNVDAVFVGTAFRVPGSDTSLRAGRVCDCEGGGGGIAWRSRSSLCSSLLGLSFSVPTS
jgi:hypothetical protein